MADCIAYVQLLIQSVLVDQLLGTKQINLPLFYMKNYIPVLHVKLQPVLYVKQPLSTTRNPATLCYTYNCHLVLYVKLPPCTIRRTATIC